MISVCGWPNGTRFSKLVIACGLLGVSALAPDVFGQPSTPRHSDSQAQVGVRGTAGRVSGSDPWNSLTPAQQVALMPLRADWNHLDDTSREKWIELADRLPKIKVAERERIQARMAQWARLKPADRGQARVRFQGTRHLTAEDRRAKWLEYQSLTPQQHETLNAKARVARSGSSDQKAAPGEPLSLSAAGSPSPAGKMNLVPNPSENRRSVRAVSPSVVRDGPGATTSPVSHRPSPPAHLQPGLPKIAATAPFVDPKTLLPRRGAQAAAIWSPAASRPAIPQ